jgi:chromate transporter
MNNINTYNQPQSPPVVSFWQAFSFWLKLGFISFGGPAGQIAIMHAELVEKRRWLSEARFLHALNYCMILPGPEAQQLATYIGWLMHRNLGGIIAGILFVLPSLILMIGLAWIYMVYGSMPLVLGLFYGIKPAVVAIVAHAAYRVGGKVLKNRWLWTIAIAAFIAIFKLQVPFPYIVFIAALIGYVGSRYVLTAFNNNTANQHGSKNTNNTLHTLAIFDDDTPTPTHAQFNILRCLFVLLTGAILWVLPVIQLYTYFGWEHTYTQMAWFFTKAALLTFGGAYAVLPYVYQGAVAHYHWLSSTQMVDGLALGESTPGPLIIIVAFVGFIGGYGLSPLPVFGGNSVMSAFSSGVIAACVVTWFTFLPSFIFILAGAPFVESTRNKLGFTAPLAAISAAVTGVIVNLALFFAYPVFWPQGFGNTLQTMVINVDWFAVGMAALAALALFIFKRSVLQVITSTAVLGLVIKTLVN